jgi:nucleoside-diphosphate-sugar epimerase
MRILITGGTGFVGSVLGPRLIEAGHQVFCACRPGSSAPFGQTIAWNVGSPTGTDGLPEAIDSIVHLAQSRSYRTFPTDSREMFDVNIAATMSLLRWAAQTKVGKFCLISSGTVYEPFIGELQEDAAVFPGSFLGASKLASENIAKPFSGLFKLSVLRLFFPFGPNQKDRLIPDLIRRVRTGEAIHVTANGEGMLFAPTFVQDIAEVILTSVEASWTGTVNVASPQVLSIRQIGDSIGRELGVVPKFESFERAQMNIVPRLDRLAERFDLDRFTRFENALQQTLQTI